MEKVSWVMERKRWAMWMRGLQICVAVKYYWIITGRTKQRENVRNKMCYKCSRVKHAGWLGCVWKQEWNALTRLSRVILQAQWLSRRPRLDSACYNALIQGNCWLLQRSSKQTPLLIIGLSLHHPAHLPLPCRQPLGLLLAAPLPSYCFPCQPSLRCCLFLSWAFASYLSSQIFSDKALFQFMLKGLNEAITSVFISNISNIWKKNIYTIYIYIYIVSPKQFPPVLADFFTAALESSGVFCTSTLCSWETDLRRFHLRWPSFSEQQLSELPSLGLCIPISQSLHCDFVWVDFFFCFHFALIFITFQESLQHVTEPHSAEARFAYKTE